MAAILIVAACGSAGPAMRAVAIDPAYAGEVQVGEMVDLDYLLEPELGSRQAPRPLCLVLPGGNADERAARAAMSTLGQALVKRGWTVVVPIAPGQRAFFGSSGRLVPTLLDELRHRPDLTDDPVVAAGISNGGISAMEIAAEEPELFSALVVVPGVLSKDTRIERLKGMPIYLRIGEQDHLNWGYIFPGVVRELREAGARVDAELLAGKGHDVAIQWTELDAWLERQLGADLPVPRLTSPSTRTPSHSRNREARTWTSRNGDSVAAILVRVEGDAVVLRLRSGRTVRIGVSQLSAPDQQYLQNLNPGARPREP